MHMQVYSKASAPKKSMCVVYVQCSALCMRRPLTSASATKAMWLLVLKVPALHLLLRHLWPHLLAPFQALSCCGLCDGLAFATNAIPQLQPLLC